MYCDANYFFRMAFQYKSLRFIPDHNPVLNSGAKTTQTVRGNKHWFHLGTIHSH